MKRIYCTTGDDMFVVLPDDVAAVINLLQLRLWIFRGADGDGYIDAADDDGTGGVDKIEMDMYSDTPFPKARALFIEWVRNGCVERRVGYD